MIREKDKPYIEAVKALVTDQKFVDSGDLQQIIHGVNKSQTDVYYTVQQVINILQYYELITINTHLGQPRHGEIVNGGRVHEIRFRS